jgi:hypothetical protein
MHTEGRIRAHRGCVVADAPTGHDDADNKKDYGGHLLAESIAWPENARRLAAAWNATLAFSTEALEAGLLAEVIELARKVHLAAPGPRLVGK